MAFAATDDAERASDAQAGRREHASQRLQGALPGLWKGCVQLATPWRFPWRRLRDSAAAMQDAKSGDDRLPWSLNAASLGAVLAVGGIASLAFSYFFDVGFFSRLGILVAEAPTSALDHLHGWVVWLPFALVLCLPVLVALPAGGSQAGESPEGSAARTSPKPVARGSLRTALWLLSGGMVVFLAGAFPGSSSPFLAPLGAAFLWIVAIRFLSAKFGGPWNGVIRRTLAAAPAVAIVAFGLGSQYAHVKTEANGPCHRVFGPSFGDGEGFVDVRIVRVFENWMLVLDEHGDAAWLALDRVTEIRDPGSRKLAAEVLCVIGILCARG